MAILNAFSLSLIAGLATGLGGGLVALFRELNMRTYDALLGFAAGVMTAIATFGLINEALTQGSVLTTLAGVAAGAAALFALDRFLPHEHEHLTFDCTSSMAYRRGLLLFAAMTLHNVPEGLAVGTSYTAQPRLGLLLALAIGLHNIPEGIAVAGPFRACGMPRRQCLAWAVGSGLCRAGRRPLGSGLCHPVQASFTLQLGLRGWSHALRCLRRTDPREPQPRLRAPGDLWLHLGLYAAAGPLAVVGMIQLPRLWAA
jgi:ZIP family zinc transporter